MAFSPVRGDIKFIEIIANTYSQVSIQVVFAVKGRENIIVGPWRDNLYRYISGTITGNGAKSLAVGGWKDHVHIFFGMPLTTCIADFMSIIKASSSKWINEQRFVRGKFHLKLRMAVGLWGIFSFQKPKRRCDKIYPDSREIP